MHSAIHLMQKQMTLYDYKLPLLRDINIYTTYDEIFWLISTLEFQAFSTEHRILIKNIKSSF